VALVDLDKLSPVALIAQFVLEHRGEGQVLPYTDYAIIEEWVAASASPDDLLVILSDLLPAHFSPEQRRGSKPRSLKALRRKVLKKVGGGGEKLDRA
jgi:hypothetical protein